MSITVRDLRAFKERGERFVMLTAYDYPTARILDEAGIPVILVGDMPFMSFHTSIDDAVSNAGRFMKEGGAHAVKLERPVIEVAAAIVDRGIPVMGHIGLGPQSVHAMGGYRVQGRTEEDARKILDEAHALDKAGIFALVLEGIPSGLAATITESISAPTIGIGAGPRCDGQVLVINDLLGLGFGSYPKFAKPYADLRSAITQAVTAYSRDVKDGTFPDEAH